MFYLVGISISFFLCLILIGKKNKTVSDYILAIWLLLIGTHLTMYYLFISKTIFQFPGLLGVHLPFPLLHGPLLYLYAASLTNNLKSNKKALVHFLPPLLVYLYLIPFFLLSAKQKMHIYASNGEGYKTFLLINFSIIVVSGIAYVIATTLLLKKHRQNILDQFSSTDKVNLDWIQNLVYGIAFIWVLVIYGNDNVLFSSVVLFVIFIGYYGIKQHGIFNTADVSISDGSGNFSFKNEQVNLIGTDTTHLTENEFQKLENGTPVRNINSDLVNPKKKYSKSGLSEESAAFLHRRLIQLMDSEKLYCLSELTLTDLAKRLNTHPNYLSQVINDLEGKNFFDYINSLRVDEFKRLVSDPKKQKFTLISLAYDSGFNSKSTFNKYFRKITGISPTDFLNKARDSKNAS